MRGTLAALLVVALGASGDGDTLGAHTEHKVAVSAFGRKQGHHERLEDAAKALSQVKRGANVARLKRIPPQSVMKPSGQPAAWKEHLMILFWCDEKLDWLDGIFCDGGWRISIFSECGGDPTDAVAAAGLKKEKSAEGGSGGGAPLACTTVHTKKMDLGPRMTRDSAYVCQIFQEVGLAKESMVVANASRPDRPTHYDGTGWEKPCQMQGEPSAWASRFDP